MTLTEALKELAKDYGSNRLAAQAHRICPQQWNKLLNWGRDPTKATLDKLGLRKVVHYEWKE